MTKVTNQTENKTQGSLLPLLHIQCQYTPAEGVLHSKELGKSNILPLLYFWSLLSFSQVPGTIQHKYNIWFHLNIQWKTSAQQAFLSPCKQTTWDCKTQKWHISMPKNHLGEKDGHVCWAPHERQDMLLRSLKLTARTPRTRKSGAFPPRGISCAGAEHEQETQHFQWALGIPQAQRYARLSCSTQTFQPARCFLEAPNPHRQHMSSESDASSHELSPLGHPCSCFSLEHRSGWCQHATYHQYR